jgi:hypothetical protein
VALVDHPIRGDDQGYVTVVDVGGAARRISADLNFAHGVAWSPDEREVYASEGDIGYGTRIDAFAMNGAKREVLNLVNSGRLQDVAATGRMLITNDSMQVAAQGRLSTASASPNEYVAILYGESFGGVADDGRSFTGSTGNFEGGNEYRAFWRLADGSAPVFLGDGAGMGMTADGRWVFVATSSRDRNVLRAEPTGPGQTRRFDLGKVEIDTGSTDRLTVTRDGTRVGFAGREGDAGSRGYVYDLDAKRPPRAVTPPGVRFTQLSPRGDLLAVLDSSGSVQIYPVDGGSPRSLPGARAGEIPVAWSTEGEALFVWDRRLPAHVERVNLASGKRETAFEWTPRDPAATLYGLLTVTRDARYWLMRYRKGASSLALADGVR